METGAGKTPELLDVRFEPDGLGEIEGAMSSLAIVVCGLMTVVAASFFAMIH